MTSSEALSLMLAFGSFIIALLTFVVLIIDKITKK
ncbi:putative holin-like toxin [Enterococcus faecalis]